VPLDESFQAITCTGTDNSKTGEHTSKNTKQTNWPYVKKYSKNTLKSRNRKLNI